MSKLVAVSATNRVRSIEADCRSGLTPVTGEAKAQAPQVAEHGTVR